MLDCGGVIGGVATEVSGVVVVSRGVPVAGAVSIGAGAVSSVVCSRGVQPVCPHPASRVMRSHDREPVFLVIFFPWR
jgi:hypothetical protein